MSDTSSIQVYSGSIVDSDWSSRGATVIDPELIDGLDFEEQEAEEARLAALAAEIDSLARDASVDLAIRIGRLVIERLYRGDLSTWRSRGAKAHSLRALARRSDLPISTSALYRSIALYELSERLGGIESWSGLGVSHLRLVLGLPDDEQRRLLDEASAASWTVAELERETMAARQHQLAQGRSSKRGGRPRLPRFVKSLNRLRKCAEASDELFGDLDALATMAPDKLAELRETIELIRSRCDQLDQALADASS